MRPCLVLLALLMLSSPALSQDKKDEPHYSSIMASLKLRNIGPAMMSGRIADIAINPRDKSTWYIAVASGGVWKTKNAGATWSPIFDSQGSYSIGCVTLDPNDAEVVWVGTGENNSQRSVSFGDGVYRSDNGGKSWTHTGLKESEHIGKILVDPRNSNVVFAAAQGPLWKPGGDRGLYRTKDRGKTWEKVLEISENTGVSDMVFDPRDPDLIYASSYQRRRHVWTLINGGPESGIYKTMDGGDTWKKSQSGLPSGDLGRIGLAISSIDPDVLYAIVEAEGDGGGFFRSNDRGKSWKKQSSYVSSSPQYYQEIVASPFVFDCVYSLDTMFKVTHDGGKTFKNVNTRHKHVDNHALAFDPDDPNYLMVGTDGGLYQSYDLGKSWIYQPNLPLTQFYRVCTDNDLPFYNVYGGTQDNSTQGGPSRTRSRSGITNSDWFLTLGGDGFESQVDPLNPNIVYSQSQYGVLHRYDRKNGEKLDIRPRPASGENDFKWNWDSPVLISPHKHTRLYFAAEYLFRSEDRGDSWTKVSPDLTRGLDRNQLEIMGRIWSMDAVSRHRSTSIYGNVVSVSESPLQEGVIFTGADDGLVCVTEDSGQTWRRIEEVEGAPKLAYVSDIETGLHHKNTVFVCFNNHKMGDYKPYIMKSNDLGVTWKSIVGNLPERGPVWTLVQDHVNKDLLFAGTEFGLFFTVDGGEHWIRMKSGLPVIAIRDLEIQRRENDLVCASFGRGFYILDDYTPLRHVHEQMKEKDAFIFPVKDSLIYSMAAPNGREKGSFGDSFFTAPNPPFGAVFTYYVKEGTKTKRAARKEGEKKAVKENKPIQHPTWEALRAEANEDPHALYLTIYDQEGGLVNRIKGANSKGLHRTAWDLHYASFESAGQGGPFVAPGIYTVAVERIVNNKLTQLGESVSFKVTPLGFSSLPLPDREKVLGFQKKTSKLLRAILGASEAVKEAEERIRLLKKTAFEWPLAEKAWFTEAEAMEEEIKRIKIALSGDRLKRKYMTSAPQSIMSRAFSIKGHWRAYSSSPTKTQINSYEIAALEFQALLKDLHALTKGSLLALEKKMEAAGAPWTPGRIPEWKK